MMLFTGLTLVVFYSCLLSARSEYINPADCKVVLYYGSSSEDSVSYPLSSAEAVVTNPNFTHEKTVLFVPDYHEVQLEGHKTQYAIDAYLRSDDVNILFLDWGAPVTSEDKVKDPYLPALVPMTADWLIKMHELIKWDAFHVLGYAKGTEFVANVVTDLFRRTHLRIHRITQLAPPQEYIVEGEHVNEDDDLITTFVDAIHTDVGDKGANVSRAHVDFYPNGGISPQPGCPDDGYCSRRRAFRYYAESVNNQRSFYAYKASSYDEFESKNKDQLGDPIPMGRGCPSSARGNYYLDTNAEPPFSKVLSDESSE